MLGGGGRGFIVNFLEELAAKRRFGMRPGLDAIRGACSALGDPQDRLTAIHVAGTNGKGAVCAMLDSCLRASGFRTGRYTSPHLVRLNERFFLDGAPVSDEVLERNAILVKAALPAVDITFFEALTAVAFNLYASEAPDYVVLETGLGGRLDATNVCRPALTVITRIGLDHCDWLGNTIPEIAYEKAGIIKTGVPVVVGVNTKEAVDVIRRQADKSGAPFIYAPDVASSEELPGDFSLAGCFNRENAVTALAALKTLGINGFERGFAEVVWPGRFQRVANFMVDGAHNPPAARALASALSELSFHGNVIAGFCGDKDADEVLRILAPFARCGLAVKTNNPRSLPADVVAHKMKLAGIDAVSCDSLAGALELAGTTSTLICGSLFLAGEALVKLGAYPWGKTPRFDASELLKAE